jgi:hypothetical protein
MAELFTSALAIEIHQHYSVEMPGVHFPAAYIQNYSTAA